MFCRHCGAEIAERYRFCLSCGAPVARDAAPSATLGESVPLDLTELEPAAGAVSDDDIAIELWDAKPGQVQASPVPPSGPPLQPSSQPAPRPSWNESNSCGQVRRSDGSRASGAAPARVRPPRVTKALFVWLGAGAAIIALLAVAGHFLTSSTRIVTKYETVTFETVHKEAPSLLEGVDYVETEGRTGTRLVRVKEWLDPEGRVENHKIVALNVIDAPVSEVVVSGGRSAAQAIDDVNAVAGRYINAWRSGDYAAMLAECSSASLGGRDVASVAAAAAVAGETVAVSDLQTPLVAGMRQLLDGSAQSDSRLTASDFPYDALAVALVPVRLELSSPLLGSRTIEGGLRLVCTTAGWKVVYDGPLAVIDVGQEKSYSQTDWGEVETATVKLEKVLLYADHLLLVVSESNQTHTGYGSSMSSEFRNLGTDDPRVFSDDSLSGSSYVVDTDLSSGFGEVDEGATQRGFIYVEPALAASATMMHVRLPNVEFLNIPVPVH